MTFVLDFLRASFIVAIEKGALFRERLHEAAGIFQEVVGDTLQLGHDIFLTRGREARGIAFRQVEVGDEILMQEAADESGLALSVCHFPPATSKWNKIEHRLFSFISSNWRGEPLRDYETIVNLIAGTTTAKGLKVTCRLDRRKYPTGREVSDAQMQCVNLERNKFHGEWYYLIKPNVKRS